MASVVEDVVWGARLSENEGGLVSSRQFKVLGLDPQPAQNVAFRALQVLMQQVPGTNYGDPHPLIPGLRVCSRDCTPVDNSRTQINIVLGYLDTSVIEVRLSGALTRETSHFDVNGDAMIVKYNPYVSGGGPEPDSTDDGTMEELCEAVVMRPGTILEYFWSSTEDTNNDIRFYTGCTNAQAWNAGEAETWLCEEYGTQGQILIANKLRGRPTHWKKHALFKYRGPTATFKNSMQEAHEQLMLYRDRFTHQAPTAVDPKDGGFPRKLSGNGWRVSAVVPFVDFSGWNLPQVLTRDAKSGSKKL